MPLPSLPLPPPFEYPLSLGAGVGKGFFPAGRFAGGAGGVGFPFAAVPFDWGRTAAGLGGGGGRACTGGGADLTSSRYAVGAQPAAEWSCRLASHQPV